MQILKKGVIKKDISASGIEHKYGHLWHKEVSCKHCNCLFMLADFSDLDKVQNTSNERKIALSIKCPFCFELVEIESKARDEADSTKEVQVATPT